MLITEVGNGEVKERSTRFTILREFGEVSHYLIHDDEKKEYVKNTRGGKRRLYSLQNAWSMVKFLEEGK